MSRTLGTSATRAASLRKDWAPVQLSERARTLGTVQSDSQSLVGLALQRCALAVNRYKLVPISAKFNSPPFQFRFIEQRARIRGRSSSNICMEDAFTPNTHQLLLIGYGAHDDNIMQLKIRQSQASQVQRQCAGANGTDLHVQ